MNFISYLGIVFIICSISTYGQAHGGPSTGILNGGTTVSTDEFISVALEGGMPGPERVMKHMDYYSEPSTDSKDGKMSKNYIYIEDANAMRGSVNGIGTNFKIRSFNSIPMTNAIPPDPHVALGPNNIIAMVNGVFYIYDRAGNVLKSISDQAWVNRAVGGQNVSDPQVIYDHFEDRWVMLWLTYNDITEESSILVSCSDDDDPIGIWYLYPTDATAHGSIPTNPAVFGDYPQVGFDDQGIYISTRDFVFSTQSFAGAKIRILNKNELYNANGGPITFTDFWSIQLTTGGQTDDLHPTISYDTGNNTAYFVIVPNSGQYYYLYKITDPISNPVLSGIRLTCSYFGLANDAQQLGGGTPLNAGAFGSGMRNSPIIRNDSLYAVHHIRNSQDNSSGSIKYFVLDLNSNSLVREVEFGALGFYYIYPAIAVDKDHNIAITYTRSGFTEYAGSYYTTKLATDPPGSFSDSQVMTEGKGNYVVTYGVGNPNRWGDYLSAALDPENEYNIILFSEYAAATNTWGTWLTEIRMNPFTGIYPFVSPTTADLGDVEVDTDSDTMNIYIANYGTDNLEIDDIALSIGPFTRVSDHNFPLTVQTYDTVTVQVVFSPTQADDYDEMLSVSSNDPSLTELHLVGHGYDMIEAYTDLFYASTGTVNNGDILTINKETGAGTTLGNSLFSEIRRLTDSPINNIIYGIANVSGGTSIVRVNAGGGDAYSLFTLDLTSPSGIAFDNLGALYVSLSTGEIYTVDLSNGNYSLVTQANISINSIAFNPGTNQLWAALLKPIGTGKDSIYTIDLNTGIATAVGATGFGIMTNDLAFDEDNRLFGITGSASASGKLIEINTENGSGTEIGEIGYNNVIGLAYSINGLINSVEENDNHIPEEFSLKQNYPNPFNPNTNIEFSLSVASDVQLNIYNILGQKVASIMNEQKPAGNYSVVWNADNSKGVKLSSGIYLYKLKASGIDGSKFQEIKKMVLLK